MATPQMRVQPLELRSVAERRQRAALRFLAAERSDEIFPVLLEEIVALGYARALVASVNYESGEIAPVAAINWNLRQQQRFRTTLYAMENPVVRQLHALRPGLVAGSRTDLYCHPLVFSSSASCWEAQRRRGECLAQENSRGARKLYLQQQVCSTCDRRSYAAIVCVDVPRGRSESAARELHYLVEIANRFYTRLFKVEHYYNRMTEMETTIGQMSTVMQSMADPVILTDAQHRVLMQNTAAERFFKLPENPAEGRVRALELNNLLFSATLSSLAISGSNTPRDLTLVDAIEGEEVLFEAVCAPTFNLEGRRTGMVTVMRDVTDLRRADEELRANYERLRSAEEVVRQDRDRLNLILENVGDPIVVCGRDADYVLLDPLAQQLFGSDPDQGLLPTQVRNRAKLDAYITAFTYSFSDRESAPLRLTRTGTRSEVEFEARSGKIYDERGQVAYTVTILRDLTAVKKLEQLRMERRMLEMEKFAAAGRLAGTIAHEVNNPMEAIKNCIYLLQGAVRKESEPVYDILKAETERVARIVRQMLGLYRNTAQVGNVDVNAIVEDTLLLFARQLERAGIQVVRQLGALPPVTGSADQLRQVLSNLVVNAKDSMGTGGRLHLRTRYLAPEERVRIVVADTGTGVPDAMQRSIFEPFVTTKGERGTGLGLWIVKGIVENHGGKIRVHSKTGKGTVFAIEFPVTR